MNPSTVDERVVTNLVKAWLIEDIDAQTHRKRKLKLLTEWPSLAQAIQALVVDYQNRRFGSE